MGATRLASGIFQQPRHETAEKTLRRETSTGVDIQILRYNEIINSSKLLLFGEA